MIGICLALIDEPSDKEKFIYIYKKYKSQMMNKAMSILHNHALSEEAVQESFLKIAKIISQLSENDDKTAALILIIVRNISLNMIKSEHINETESLTSKEDIPDLSLDILKKIISQDGYNELIAVISGTDHIYRDILIMKIVYGYECDEISQILGIPKRTVETRLYRGKKIIRRKLEEKYENEYLPHMRFLVL